MHLFFRIIPKILFFLLAIAFGVSQSAPAIALTLEPTTNQAGLVVVQADGSVMSRCVGFNEESINGYELLTRGGFVTRSEVTSVGASVCSIEGQGCGEGEDCFCQCKSSTCVYWTYWQQLPEGWRYSNAGAATVQVHDGDVQGWVWGDSSPNAAAENAPPTLAFTDISTPRDRQSSPPTQRHASPHQSPFPPPANPATERPIAPLRHSRGRVSARRAARLGA